MKHFLTILGVLCFGFAQAQHWQDSFDDALAAASQEDKPIVLVFSGSDWCGPCIRFKRSILDSDEFVEYADKHYVLFNADFPKKKKNQLPPEKLNVNKSLFETYNPKGHFPLVVVLDKEKSVLGTTGFNKKASPSDYISLFNGFVQ
ncbi:MAG: thioredoxin family protein [Bacteroidota bacterium]